MIEIKIRLNPQTGDLEYTHIHDPVLFLGLLEVVRDHYNARRRVEMQQQIKDAIDGKNIIIPQPIVPKGFKP